MNLLNTLNQQSYFNESVIFHHIFKYQTLNFYIFSLICNKLHNWFNATFFFFTIYLMHRIYMLLHKHLFSMISSVSWYTGVHSGPWLWSGCNSTWVGHSVCMQNNGGKLCMCSQTHIDTTGRFYPCDLHKLQDLLIPPSHWNVAFTLDKCPTDTTAFVLIFLRIRLGFVFSGHIFRGEVWWFRQNPSWLQAKFTHNRV